MLKEKYEKYKNETKIYRDEKNIMSEIKKNTYWIGSTANWELHKTPSMNLKI